MVCVVSSNLSRSTQSVFALALQGELNVDLLVLSVGEVVLQLDNNLIVSVNDLDRLN